MPCGLLFGRFCVWIHGHPWKCMETDGNPCKSTRSTLQNLICYRMSVSRASGTPCGSVFGRFCVSRCRIGVTLGSIWGHLGVALGDLYATWGHFGVTLGHLGATLRQLRAPLGYLGATLGHLWVTWEPLGNHLGTLGSHFGAFWRHFKVSLG